jgi:hypothetical protein
MNLYLLIGISIAILVSAFYTIYNLFFKEDEVKVKENTEE